MLAHSGQIFALNVVLRACAGQRCEVCRSAHSRRWNSTTDPPAGRPSPESGTTEWHHFTVCTTRKTTLGENSSQDQAGGSQNCIPSTSAHRFCFLHVHRHCKCLTQQTIMTESWKCVATFLRVPFLSQPPAPSALVRPSTFMRVCGEKNPLPSAFPPIWLSPLPWLWQTQLPHNRNLSSMHLLSFHTGFTRWSVITSLLKLDDKLLSSHSRCSMEGF